MVGPLGLYGIAQGIDELDAPVLFVGHVLGRDGTVKNHVCMCRAGHNAQVVDVGHRREFLDLTLQKRLQLVRVGVTGHDGVKVDRRDQPVLHKQVPLNAVNDIVTVHDVVLSVHFQMEADQAAAGAVVVDHQIVHAQHAGIAQGLFLNMLDQIRVRRRTQQRIDGVFDEHCTAVQNERRHTDTHQSVNADKAGELCQNRGCQNRCRRDDIVAGIGGGGQQRFRVDGRADLPVQSAHPELDEDGCNQYCNHEPAESDLRRVQNLGKALLQKLHADDQDHDRDRQPGQILIPGMAVGMLRVRRARAEFEADEADDIGTGIGQVVHTVGGDGNAAGQYTDGDLAARQQ